MNRPVRSTAFAKPFARLWSAAQTEAAAPSAPTVPLYDLGGLCSRPRARNEAAIRALCSSVNLGVGTALCRALGRYKMFVDVNDAGLSPHLMLDGYWEMWLTEALAATLRPGMVFADVGANLGYFTLLAADLVGSQGRVHAFEPNPPIAGRLRRSVQVNGFAERVSLHECALSDVEGGEAFLAVPEGEPKNAHITQADAPTAVRIPTHRFDRIKGLERADVVKIDAEGAEEAIWRGMEGVLSARRSMTVFLEFAPVRYASPRGFLDLIAAFGFSLNLLDPERGVRPAGVKDILAAPPHEDRMLVLRR